VLGPVQVETPAGLVPIGGRRSRTLLAALVIGVGRDVSQDTLIEAVWGSQPPPHATAALQSHVSKLRHVLGVNSIVTEDHSYRLVADCDQIDACRFQRDIQQAASVLPADPTAARTLVREATELWRGAPFGELSDEEFCYLETQRLGELRRTGEEIELEAGLALGMDSETVPALQAAVVGEPYRERRWYLLIYALARSGRRVEALRVHNDLAMTLGAVGLAPTHAFDDLAAMVAAGDPLPPLATV